MSEPDDPVLTVSLSRSEWVALATSLGQRPYSEVAEMIEAIAVQLRTQLAAAENGSTADGETGAPRSH